MKPARALFDIAAGLTLFVLSSVAAAWAASYLPVDWSLPSTVVLQGVLVIGVVGLLLARRNQRWSDIDAVPPDASDGPRGLLACAACLGVNMLFIQVLYAVAPRFVESHSERLGDVVQQLSGGLPLPGLLLVLGFVGVYEELFARGLLLARCRALMGGTWSPVLVSSLLFGLGHLYQGWIGVAQTTLIGVVLAVAVLRWGSLWPAIIAHALLDVSSVLFMASSR